ncbi:MAG: hypothetical protein SGBAC_008075, partial [Bacillariaceae sp.]
MAQIQQANNGDNFVFPIDLIELSKQHVGFLQTLHQLGVTIQRPSPKALQRYRDFWLPLVNSHPKQALIPPTDCAWLWHCHRLAPFRYVSYLKRQFGDDFQILEANPAFSFQCDNGEIYGTLMQKTGNEDMNAAAERTRSCWNQQFPEESFHLQMYESSAQNVQNAEEKIDDSSLFLDGFDLLGSTDRQATFLWQVSGPLFVNDDFLQQGALQYYKFLKLRNHANKSKIVIVPTYQIDLMWHTHMLSSLTGYFADCKAIMGSTLNHDDSLNDRSDDGPLDRAFKDTKSLWNKIYEEEYFVEGGMYRGEPPKEYYYNSWLSRISNEEAQIPLGPFLHMIDVQGASSTNPNGDELTNEQLAEAKWTPLSENAPNGAPAFIQMAIKSKVKGVNANPFMEDYIFGKTGSQVGYFHITTKESYGILSKRISARIKKKENDVALAACCTLGLCSGAKWKKKMDAEIDMLKTTKAITKARSTADAPFGKIGIPPQYKNDKQVSNTHYSEAGAWLFPATYYECGGGCGGGAIGAGHSGPGGGASACGAAACGAAGCAGGGCGGGCGGG